MMNQRLTLLALSLCLSASCGGETSEGVPQPAETPVDAGADTSTASVQDTKAEEPGPKAPASMLFSAGFVHDFGAVSDVHDLTFDFEFMNVGDETLEIQELDPSCGCTALELEKKEYAGGEVGRIGVAWDVEGHGLQHKTIKVLSNAQEGNLVLTVVATIDPFVRFEPAQIDLGGVRNDREQRRPFSLVCKDPAFMITGVKGTVAGLQAVVVGEPSAGRAQLELVLGPQDRRGFLAPKIEVQVAGRLDDGAQVQHTATLGVRANLYDELLAEPGFIAAGRVTTGTIRQEARLTRPDGGPFAILSAQVDGDAPALSATWTALDDGNGYLLVVEGPVGSFKGQIRGRLRVRTNVAEEPERVLSIMGMVP